MKQQLAKSLHNRIYHAMRSLEDEEKCAALYRQIENVQRCGTGNPWSTIVIAKPGRSHGGQINQTSSQTYDL